MEKGKGKKRMISYIYYVIHIYKQKKGGDK